MIKDHNNLIDHQIKQGDSWDVLFTHTNENGEPYDLTDVEFECQIRTKDGDLINEPAISGSPEGVISIEIRDTDDWPLGVHEWDIRLTFPDGSSRCIPDYGVSIFQIGRSVSKKA